MNQSLRRALRALGTMAIVSCTSAAFAQPANDNCAAGGLPVIPGAGGTVNGDATGATQDGAIPCAGQAGGGDVWFTFTPSQTGPYRFSMCSGSTWDSVLSLHTSCSSASIACNDDFCGFASSSEFLSGTLTAGTQYFVRVAEYGPGDGGAFALTVTFVTPLTNDECGPTNPQVFVGTPVSGSTAGATTSVTITPNTVCGPAGGAGGGSDVFYRFIPPSSGVYSFDLCGSSYDTVLSIHSGCPADSANVIGCNDDSTATVPCASGGLQSAVPSLTLTGGQTYYVRVAGYTAATGNYVLNVTSGGPLTGACCASSGACTSSLAAACTAPSVYLGDGTTCGAPACPPSGSCCSSTGDCTQTFQANCTATWTANAVCTPNPCPQPPAPANDECANAVPLTIGAPPVTGDAFGSTQSTTGTCTGSTRDVWYKFTSPTTQQVRVVVVPNPNNAFSVVAFDSCGGAEVACSAVPGNGTTNFITFSANAGTNYQVRVAAFPPVTSDIGMFTIQVILPVLPSNDECANAIVIPGSGGTASGDNTDATTSVDLTPTNCGTFGFSGGGQDLFYSFTPTTAGDYNVDLCNSDFDTVLSIHSGCPANDGNIVSCNDDSNATTPCPNSGVASAIPSVNLAAGTTYYIRVAGYGDSTGAATGAFTLNVTLNGSPTTGACCAAATGACTVSDQASCTGTFQGLGTNCSPNPCPQPNTGACCAAGSCSLTTQAQCSGTYQGNNTSCSPNPCPQATGACCATAGTCSIQTLAACTTAGGTYRGNGTSCLPNPCPAPSGVCCTGATCATSTAANCTGTYTAFSSATTCNAAGNFTTPCCHANYNKVAGITVQDVFDFLVDWFNQLPRANLSNNGNGAPTVQSVFDFLSAWFSGGCS